MPFNKMLTYSDVLNLNSYSEKQRIAILYSIYERDIFNNNLKFQGKEVRPTQMNSDLATKDTLFSHLTCKEVEVEGGIKKRDYFDIHRSKRIHWIKFHINVSNPNCIKIFNYKDRIRGRDSIRTYIYDEREKYVIILELKRSSPDYFYLLSAYYLDEKYGEKQIKQKYKKRELD